MASGTCPAGYWMYPCLCGAVREDEHDTNCPERGIIFSLPYPGASQPDVGGALRLTITEARVLKRLLLHTLGEGSLYRDSSIIEGLRVILAKLEVILQGD